MERSELLVFWTKTVEEQLQYLHGYQNRVAFYTGTITAILGASLALAFRSSSTIELMALLAGPILIGLIGQNGIVATTRIYRLHLEAITTRFKLQDLLGFHEPQIGAPATWANNSLAPKRHQELWQAGEEAFVKTSMESGYHALVLRLFRGFQVVAVIGATALFVRLFS